MNGKTPLFLILLLIIPIIFAEDQPPYEIPDPLNESEMEGAPSLSSPYVYPEFGVPCTNFTYSVIYRDEEGRAPEYIKINLNNEWHNLTKISGTYQSGATYIYRHVPTSGKSNFYYFEASNGVGKARAGIIDSPNQGPMIYSEKFDNNQIILLSKESNQSLWTFNLGTDLVNAVAISGDGDYVAIATHTSVYLFSILSNESLWRYCHGCQQPPLGMTSYSGVAISSNGSYVAGTIGEKLYLFSKDNNTPLWSSYIESSAIGIDISADGNYIAVGVANAGSYGDKIFFFSKESNESLWEYKAEHPGYEQTGNFYRPDMTLDGQYVAVSSGCPDRRAYLFSRNGTLLFRSQMLTQDSPVHKSAISDNGSLIAYSADHNSGLPIVFLYSQNGTQLWNFSSPTDATSRAISISSDGNYIAAGTTGGRVYLFSKETNTPLWSFSAPGNYSNIGDVKLSSSGDYLIAGGTTNKIYLFSKNQSQPLWSFNANTWLNAVDFNDNYIIAGTGIHEYLYEGNTVSTEEIECQEIIQPLEYICGNGNCENQKGETPENCPEDCLGNGEEELGDINLDGIVSLNDLGILGQAWGSSSGDLNYNSNADLNNDGSISLLDLAILGQNWGNIY